jgi:hypothetical protein
MKPILLLAVLALGFPLVDTSTAQNEGKVELRLLALPPRVAHPALNLLQGEGKALEVETAANRLTGPYEVSRQQPWIFVPVGAAGGKAAVLATCKPIASQNQLAVLVRNDGDAGTYKAFALDLAKASFDERQFLMVNLSANELAAEVGGKRVALEPGKPVVVAPAADKGPDLCQVAVFTRKDDAWSPIFSTAWPLRDKVRGLVFFYQDAASGKILLHAVTDFM